MDPSTLLDDLDAEQRHAVATDSRLVAVIAGAGSGKTRVLTRRIAHRVVTGTADARHTLALTFTREAASELRRRLPRLGLGERVEAGTFHSVMLLLLRQRWADRNRPPPTLVDDRRRMVSAVAGRAGLDEVVGEINWASARAIAPEAYASEARRAGRKPSVGTDRIATLFADYREYKRRRGVVDLDDVLGLAVEALQYDHDFAAATRWRFRHLLVDEAQDLNPVQHRLVDLLRHDHDDLFLVGDPAQAIFAFNGTDPSLLIDVSDRFPGIEIVRLPTNHRCTPQIVEAGAHVLTTGGQPTTVRSGRPDGHAVRVVDCTDEAHEAATVARLVRHLDPGLVGTGGVAVLARTNAQLDPIRAAIESAGIPVRRRIEGAGSPYRDAVGAAARQGSAVRLRAWAHDLLDGLDPDGDGVTPTPEQVQVAESVLDFLREQPLGDGVAYRSWVSTTDPFDLRDDRGVELLTFHGSKGREWHTVYVTGVETGLVPIRSASTQAERAEEARLLYVATTRATDELIVTWCGRRGGYQRKPSPLIATFVPLEAHVAPPPADLVVVDSIRRSQRELHDELGAWRDQAARAAGILPDAICSSAMLKTIADQRPTSVDELAQLTGMGVLTASRLYPGIARVLDTDQSRRSTSTGA
ncbi:MAG TPA: ATP-dependent DNA helicase UvrD2 [Ilumatobacteraceae bacterium]|nr:ATP-dependent DNA helicase UvrD2 [Ilumatobacteraceae bacterium]